MTDFLPEEFSKSDHFVGREKERAELSVWFESKPSVYVLLSIGGMGKTTLAQTWIQESFLKSGQISVLRPRIFWWSFYAPNSGFRTFLLTLSSWLRGQKNEKEFNIDNEGCINGIIRSISSERPIIILDGLERELRQYSTVPLHYEKLVANECVDPLAAFFLSRVLNDNIAHMLITSRQLPNELIVHEESQCTVKALSGLSDEEVVKYFYSSGISGTPREVIQVSAKYGHHPLALKILVGRLRAQQEVNVAQALDWDLTFDIMSKSNHVLHHSFSGLSEVEMTTMRIVIADPDNLSKAVVSLLRESVSFFQAGVDSLFQRGLLESAKTAAIHPVVRLFAQQKAPAGKREHDVLAGCILVASKGVDGSLIENIPLITQMIYHFSRSSTIGVAIEALNQYFSEIFFWSKEYEILLRALLGFFDNGKSIRPREDLPLTAKTALMTMRSNCLNRLGEFKESLSILSDVLKLDRLGASAQNEGITLMNTTRILLSLGNLAQAKETLDQVDSRILSEPEVAARYNMYSGYVGGLERNPVARSQVVAAANYFEGPRGLSPRQAAQSFSVAAVYAAETMARLGLDGEAQEWLVRALDASALAQATFDEGRILYARLLCELLSERHKDTAKLKQLAEASLLYARINRFPDLEVRTMVALAFLEGLSDNWKQSRSIGLRAARYAARLGMKQQLGESHAVISACDQIVNLPDDSAFHAGVARENIVYPSDYARLGIGIFT